MAWPFEFLDLSQADKLLRRQELDRYASIAQLSVVLPVAAGLLYRVVNWARNSRTGAYDAIPNYPSLKAQRQRSWTGQLQKIKWWLGEDVVVFGTVRGQRDQWVFGTFWTFWLLLLCLLDTHRGMFNDKNSPPSHTNYSQTTCT